MSATKDVTVYIGRFSPFHSGHAEVLKRALETSKLVIVLIGSSGQSRSLKNPFTFEERRAMIEKWERGLPTCSNPAALRILPLRDHPYNDALWIRSVQKLVKKTIDGHFGTNVNQIHITGSDRDESTWYLKSFPQWQQSLVAPVGEGLSATLIRTWMFEGMHSAIANAETLPESTKRFLANFLESDAYTALQAEYDFVKKYKQAWEVAPYAPTFVTTDAVVVQSGHVLVVKRGANPGKGLWALPGGFLNQNERLRDGAIRELVEETGLRLAEGKKGKEITREILKGSIHTNQTFDKPDRSARGRTITTAFLFRLDDTKPLPKVRGLDDAEDAFWIPIAQALDETDRWFEDHLAIIETLIAGLDF